MSTALERYRELEEELRKLRLKQGVGVDVEAPIIELMTDTWWLLTDTEQAMIDAEGSTCWPHRAQCCCGTVTTQAPRTVVSYFIPNCPTRSTIWCFDPHAAPCGQPCIVGINSNWPQGVEVEDVHGAIGKSGRHCPRGCYAGTTSAGVR